MIDIPFDLGEIAKTLGGLFAFAFVLYIGVLFYKKEASFSEEYQELLRQYKERNDNLQDEIDDLKETHKTELKEANDKIDELEGMVQDLKKELGYLRNFLINQTPKV